MNITVFNLDLQKWDKILRASDYLETVHVHYPTRGDVFNEIFFHVFKLLIIYSCPG